MTLEDAITTLGNKKETTICDDCFEYNTRGLLACYEGCKNKMTLDEALNSRKESEEEKDKMRCRYDKHKECDKKSFHFCEDCQMDMNQRIDEADRQHAIEDGLEGW